MIMVQWKWGVCLLAIDPYLITFFLRNLRNTMPSCGEGVWGAGKGGEVSYTLIP